MTQPRKDYKQIITTGAQGKTIIVEVPSAVSTNDLPEITMSFEMGQMLSDLTLIAATLGPTCLDTLVCEPKVRSQVEQFLSVTEKVCREWDLITPCKYEYRTQHLGTYNEEIA